MRKGMKEGKLIHKIFRAALVLVLIGMMLGGLMAPTLHLGVLGKNRVSAKEGVSYTIAGIHNPERIELSNEISEQAASAEAEDKSIQYDYILCHYRPPRSPCSGCESHTGGRGMVVVKN